MLRDVNPGLDDKSLLDIALDNQITKFFTPVRICEEVIVANEHDIGLNRFQLFNYRFDGPFRVAPLLSERIETEGAEFAFEWTSSCGQYRIECVVADSNSLHKGPIVVLSK